VHSDEGQNIKARYERLIRIFADKEDDLFMEWARTVPRIVDMGLDRRLVCREIDGVLLSNFDPDLLAVLKEVNYLKQMSRSDIPKEAIEVQRVLQSRKEIERYTNLHVRSWEKISKLRYYLLLFIIYILSFIFPVISDRSRCPSHYVLFSSGIRKRGDVQKTSHNARQYSRLVQQHT